MRYRFIGKFRDLIPMGFTFQRLYADNRISYCKENVFIFRSGKHLSCNQIDPSEKDLEIIKELKEKGMIE